MWTYYTPQYGFDDWVSAASKILKLMRFTTPEWTKLMMFKNNKSSNEAYLGQNCLFSNKYSGLIIPTYFLFETILKQNMALTIHNTHEVYMSIHIGSAYIGILMY